MPNQIGAGAGAHWRTQEFGLGGARWSLWNIFISFKVCADAKQKLLQLLIPSKTATLVTEFAVEDLPLGRIAALVPEFSVKDLPLGRTL